MSVCPAVYHAHISGPMSVYSFTSHGRLGMCDKACPSTRQCAEVVGHTSWVMLGKWSEELEKVKLEQEFFFSPSPLFTHQHSQLFTYLHARALKRKTKRK